MNFELDVTKDERQRQGAEIWMSKRKGTLNYIMRFGKTRVGCIIMGKLLKENADCKIIIAVPSDIIRKNWYVDIVRNSDGDVLPEDAFNKYKIGILTADELVNAPLPIKCDLLIVDEIHKFTSAKRLSIIRGNKVSYSMILGLTGTFPNKEEKIEINKHCPVIDSISDSEAISNGWISDFVEYNIPLELSEEDKFKYIKLTMPIKKMLSQFKNTARLFQLSPGEFMFKSDYDLIVACVSGKVHNGKYYNASNIRLTLATIKGWSKDIDTSSDYGRELDASWNPNRLVDDAQVFINSIRSRSEIINNNPVKLKAVLDLFTHFTETTICFNESTDFADQIVNLVNYKFKRPIAIAYHSNVKSQHLVNPETGTYYTYKSGPNHGLPKVFGKDSIKNIALEGVMSGKYLLLSTARALDEGLSLSNIKQVITTAGTTNPLQYKQRNARGRTVDIYDPDKVTRIFNLYFEDFYDYNNLDTSGIPKLIHCRDKDKLIIRQESANKVIFADSLNAILTEK